MTYVVGSSLCVVYKCSLSCVGIPSIDLLFWEKSCFCTLLVWSYRRTTKHSSTSSWSLIEVGSGVDANVQNAGVTSSHIFQIYHIVLFPLPAKNDTVLNTSRKGKELHFSGQRKNTISQVGRYLKLLTVTKATHNNVDLLNCCYS